MDKFVNNLSMAKEIWAKGEKINRYIGFDAGEPQRKERAFASDMADKKYAYHYPLIDKWNMDRDECAWTIDRAGLPRPRKSSCFCCPSMKKKEIFELRDNHPNLLQRALDIESNAADGLTSIKGLGGYFAWRDLIYGKKGNVKMCGVYDDDPDMPCGCYDG